MPAEVTSSNPTGVESFDHRAFVALPEYAAVSNALEELVTAINRSPAEMGQADWLRIVGEMAAALGYADSCERCVEDERPSSTPAPYAAVVKGDQLDGHYRCPACGFEWTCFYAVNLPVF